MDAAHPMNRLTIELPEGILTRLAWTPGAFAKAYHGYAATGTFPPRLSPPISRGTSRPP
jgi:hypothetical protein